MRPARILSLLAALAGLPAVLAGDASPAPRPLPPEPERTEAITAAELLFSDAWLADDARSGRETGTEGCRESARWLAGRFRRMGLAEIEGAPGFLQPWDMPGGVPVPEGCSLALAREGGEPRVFAYGKDFVALEGGSGVAVEGPVLFAGYGIRAPEMKYDDYGTADARGRVVVVFRHEPRERDGKSRWNGDRMTRHSWFPAKAAAAKSAGAAALIVVNDPLHHEDDRLDASSAGIRGDLGIPVLLAGRAFADEVLRGTGRTAADLQKALDDADAPVPVDTPGARASLRVTLRTSASENVVGAIPGSDPVLKDEWVVVGAHYDHVGLGRGGGLDPRQWGQVHNGADDNASGTAAMLEIAEAFALAKGRTRRSLLFAAFAGEEKGLLGSSAFVRKAPVPVPAIVAMVNLDMVGRYRPGQFEVVGAATGTTLRETVDAAAGGLGLEYEHTNAGLANSDGYSFYGAGVPTVFFFTGLHDEYHRTADDWWLVNAEGAAKVAALAARTVRALADADGRPAFRPVDRESMAMGRRSRIILGVILDDAAAGKGAVVQSVSPRSPAAAAGLQAGDRVVSFGGRDVKGADDLRAALNYVRPGDSAAARIVRGEETLEKTVVFPAPPGPVFGVAYAAEEDGGRGALVQEVAPGSVAEAAGVRPGDRILSFGGKEVRSGAVLAGVLRTAHAGDTIEVKVLRDGRETDLKAQFPK